MATDSLTNNFQTPLQATPQDANIIETAKLTLNMGLPAKAYKDALHDIIKERFQFKDFNVDVSAGSALGDNYMGVVYRAAVEDTVTKTKKNVIVKVPPQNSARREEFNARLCFMREIYLYSDVLETFRVFQESKGIVPEENGFNEYPVCYKTLQKEPHEGIYMEDLKVLGFDMWDRHTPVTADHVNLVMTVLGKFHAISFAMKDQEKSKFQKYTQISEIFEAMLGQDNKMESWTNTIIDKALKTLDPETDADLIKKSKIVFGSKYGDEVIKTVKGADCDEYAVVCHGDCWNNNMFFKNDKNGKPVDIRLLDWQIARYSSPVCDLTYYIFANTNKELRDKHYQDFLRTYHNSLSEFLKRLGSDPEKIFPFSALQSELQRVGRFGLLMAIMILPIITTKIEETPNMDEMAEQMQNGAITNDFENVSEDTKDKYNKRMRDVIVDLAAFGYI